MKSIKQQLATKPLFTILAIALILRLLAAIFSQGYGMHDDHFSIIEAAQSWADDTDYDNWLPKHQAEFEYQLSSPSYQMLRESGVPDSTCAKLNWMSRKGFENEHAFNDELTSFISPEEYRTWKDVIYQAAQIGAQPSGHSFFYVGLHYVAFEIMQACGITSMKVKMLLIRVIHAVFSLLIVYFGFLITKKIMSHKPDKIADKYAREVGILLVVLWFMPFLSVRNLIEIACIPFLMWGIWLIINTDSKQHNLFPFFLAGLIMAFAFSVRFQVAIFIAGSGLAILLHKKWKETIVFGLGVLVSIAVIQGVTDFFVWGKPFVELKEYIRYNIAHKNSYGAPNHPEMYFTVLCGILIPPLGLLYFFGFLRTWRKHFLIFVPVILFFAFHTYFPNKQERFIFPVIPFFVILGVCGWREFLEISKFWLKYPKLLKLFYIFFWVINILALSVLTFTYSKKSRVEAMAYFSNIENVTTILLEDANQTNVTTLPNAYSEKWLEMYKLPRNEMPAELYNRYSRFSTYVKIIFSPEFFNLNPDLQKPQYVLFFDSKNLAIRVQYIKKYYPNLTEETVIKPGFVDQIVHFLNPKNRNETIFIYKTNI